MNKCMLQYYYFKFHQSIWTSRKIYIKKSKNLFRSFISTIFYYNYLEVGWGHVFVVKIIFEKTNKKTFLSTQ
jgi:hypothetical protein